MSDTSPDMRPDDPPREAEARLDELLDGWFDDDLGPAETAELEAVLLRSPGARRRFWDTARFQVELHEALALADSGGELDGGVEPGETAARAGRSWWPAAMLAGLCLVVGGGLGALLASRALAGLEQGRPRLSILAEGFETGDAPLDRFVPVVAGVWSGDLSAVVGPAGGVEPCEGKRMLQFLRPTPAGGDSAGEIAAEIWQVVPIDSIRSQFRRGDAGEVESAGGLMVELVASFNQRCPEDGPQAKAAGGGIYAFRGDAKDAPRLWKSRESSLLASSRVDDRLDREPAGWQRLRAILAVPAGTDFLLLHCYVRDHERRPDVVFDGQYMDDIRLTAWTDPESSPAGVEPR